MNQSVKILNLHGSWHEMGRQYGAEAQTELQLVWQFLENQLTDDSKWQRYTHTAQLLISQYPAHLLDFLSGMADTSGFSREQLILLNAVEYAEADFACSGLAVWGDYSKGNLLYGRNYDCMSYAPLARAVVLTIFHPEDCETSVAIVGYAGEIYAVNGFNSCGLMFALNNGMPSAGFDIHYEMSMSTTELLNVMFRARTMDDMDRFFHETRSAASFIIGVADSHEARAYEWCYDGVQRADTLTPDGLTVLSNHYVHPAWPYPTPDNEFAWLSLDRRCNLLRQADAYKGQIDVARLKQIMATPIPDGGPLHPFTRLQFVYEPATLTLHLRVLEASPWTTIPLEPYFNDL